MDRAVAPPPEASPTQESPPPEAAVAEPSGDASHEAGTAASINQDAEASASTDASAEETASMPDRLAGAVEGTQATDARGPGVLEAMMAAAFFRPAPAAEQAEATSTVSLGHAASPSSQPVETAVLAVTQMVEGTEETPAVPIEAPMTDAASEAMRVAAQAAQATQRLPSTRGKAGDVTSDAGANSAFEIETPTLTMRTEQDGTTPLASATDSTEAASTPFSLLEGMSDVEVVEVITTKPAMRLGDVAGSVDGDATTRTVLVAGTAATGEGTLGANASTATKASGVPPLPVAAQLAETVRAAVMRGDHEIRLILNPGDLGQIDIRIVEQGGALHLRLEATKGSTHDLLAREMPSLRQALETRDLRVERIQVSHSGSSSASADGSGAAWQQGFGRQGQQQKRDGSPAWSPVAALDGARHEYGAHHAPRLIRHQGVQHRGVLDRVA